MAGTDWIKLSFVAGATLVSVAAITAATVMEVYDRRCPAWIGAVGGQAILAIVAVLRNGPLSLWPSSNGTPPTPPGPASGT